MNVGRLKYSLVLGILGGILLVFANMNIGGVALSYLDMASIVYNVTFLGLIIGFTDNFKINPVLRGSVLGLLVSLTTSLAPTMAAAGTIGYMILFGVLSDSIVTNSKSIKNALTTWAVSTHPAPPHGQHAPHPQHHVASPLTTAHHGAPHARSGGGLPMLNKMVVGLVLVLGLGGAAYYGLPSLLDSTPPSMITDLTATDLGGGKQLIEWTASTDTDVTGYEVYKNGVLLLTTTASSYVDSELLDGVSYTYQVQAVDSSNNKSDLSTPLTTAVTLSLSDDNNNTVEDDEPEEPPIDPLALLYAADNINPTISSVTPASGAIVGLLPTITVNYTDNLGIDTNSIVFKVDGMIVNADATITSTKATYTPDSELSETVHNAYFEVKDLGGNETTKSWSFTIMESRPVILENTARPAAGTETADNTPKIILIYSDPDGVAEGSIKIYINDVNYTPYNGWNTRSNTSIEFEVPSTRSLSDGETTVLIEVPDDLGNVASYEWTFNII